jgi:hypothetical protein
MRKIHIGVYVLFAASCSPGAEDSDLDSDLDDDRQTIAFDRVERCDVIVAGGSTAALAAAVTSAREGAVTCLTEPTDWVGGQLTAAAVPAIDHAWHKVGALDVGALSRDPANLPVEFAKWMQALGNPGACWVSHNCFRPDRFHADVLQPLLKDPALKGRLRLLDNTVIKQVYTEQGPNGPQITDVFAVRRTPVAGAKAQFLSAQLPDWYDLENSPGFTKEVIRLTGPEGGRPVVIDATELGDVLVLSFAPYLQGAEASDGSTETKDELCGQATVMPFVMRYDANAGTEPPNPFAVDHPDFYSIGKYTWDQVWRYRRLVDGSGSGYVGDRSLQNWNPGNDYNYGYLFLKREATEAQRDDWAGGIDFEVLAGAERHAYGWYWWLKDRTPDGMRDRVKLDREVLGSPTGLAKFPYLRDTRRSIGIDGYVLPFSELTGPESKKTGVRYPDRVALGSYLADIHPLRTCKLPGYFYGFDPKTLPYYIPLRALTNDGVDNLLVAGKTIAQSLLASAATRMQPTEWATGIAAGAAAATMVAKKTRSTRDALKEIVEVQKRVRNHAPIDWTIGGSSTPTPTPPGGGSDAECTECINGGGGKACASRCPDPACAACVLASNKGGKDCLSTCGG